MLAALDSCLQVQVTYGAVLLSFLGRTSRPYGLSVLTRIQALFIGAWNSRGSAATKEHSD